MPQLTTALGTRIRTVAVARLRLGEHWPKAAKSESALLKALADEDANVRAHAAQALAALDDKSPATIDRLAGLTTDSDAGVRRRDPRRWPFSPDPMSRFPSWSALEDADPWSCRLCETLAEGARVGAGLIEALDHPRRARLGDAGVGRGGPAAKQQCRRLLSCSTTRIPKFACNRPWLARSDESLSTRRRPWLTVWR